MNSKKDFLKKAAVIILMYMITVWIFYLGTSKTYRSVDIFSSLRLFIFLLFTPIAFKYIVYIFIAPFYPIQTSFKLRKSKYSYIPSVSVLIAAHNEEVGIASTIQSVVNTNYPNLEIIVINDGSKDSTGKIVKEIISDYKKKKCKVSVRYREITNSGKSRALNKALFMAKNEIIITVDADSVMDKDCIANIIRYFSDKRVAAVAGNVIIGNKNKSLGLIQQLEYLYGFYFKRADSIMSAVYIVGGAAAAYRKNIVKESGGFNEQIITEDIELSTRLQYLGYMVKYASNAIVYTEAPLNIRGLMKQRLRWKYGRLMTFYKYRKLFFSFESKHNNYLSFIILPIAIFSEILLLLEYPLLAIFYFYTFYSRDFLPLIIFITILTIVIIIQIISDSNRKYHTNLFVLAPISWLLFYVMDFVEFQAITKSIYYIFGKRKLEWQSWARNGVFGIEKK